MLPAVFNSLALLISLNIQSIALPIAGAWLLFYYVGCALAYAPTRDNGLVYTACVAWLCTLGVATFILAPVANGAAWMWTLAAMPVLALSLRKQDIRPHLVGFGIVLGVYALGLIAQQVLGVHYTGNPENVQTGRSWPMLDPNNAAAVLNAGVIASFYLALRHSKRWWAAVALFACALAITHSRAGCVAAAVGCLSVLIALRHWRTIVVLLVAASLTAATLYNYHPGSSKTPMESLLIRPIIWEACLPLLQIRPLAGLGLGTFGYYYGQVRTEHITTGGFAHNDLLQFAIELGIPALCVFLVLIGSVVVTTCRRNAVAAAYMLAVLLQACVEFQFYVPPVSLLLGLALAYHRLNPTTSRYST